MKNEKNELLEKQKKRYIVLKNIYYLTKGSTYVDFCEQELLDLVELSKDELNSIIEYLKSEKLIRLLDFDSFLLTHEGVKEVEKMIEESTDNLPPDKLILQELQQFNSNEICNQWQKCLNRRELDPDGAITTARTLLESVCKHILDESKIKDDTNKIDLPDLYKKTAQVLNLSPSKHTEDVFKQILGGCSGIVSGLGTLRNRLGDSHGQGKDGIKPDKKHAELAVNLAGAMALYLVKTFYEKN